MYTAFKVSPLKHVVVLKYFLNNQNTKKQEVIKWTQLLPGGLDLYFEDELEKQLNCFIWKCSVNTLLRSAQSHAATSYLLLDVSLHYTWISP